MAAGMNPMDLRRGINMAVEHVVQVRWWWVRTTGQWFVLSLVSDCKEQPNKGSTN